MPEPVKQPAQPTPEATDDRPSTTPPKAKNWMDEVKKQMEGERKILEALEGLPADKAATLLRGLLEKID